MFASEQAAEGAAPSLTVRQYSDAVLQKYLQRRFAPGDAAANLAQAADALYELLARLRRVAGKQGSEDEKAPLKAIRDAVDSAAYNSSAGAESPEVDAMFALYARLEDVCEEHMAGGGDRETAALVQEALRYRLMRLVTGNQWEGSPKLKLRVLKLMFSFMARENEKILAAGPRTYAPSQGASPGSLGRSTSGRRAALAAPAPCSRWGEAINEMAKMPGSRLLPLLKLCLLENLQLSTAAKEAAAAVAASTGGTTDAAPAGPPVPRPASAVSDAAGGDGTSASSSEGPAEARPAGPAGAASVSRAGTAATSTGPATPVRPGRLHEAPAAPSANAAVATHAEPARQAHRRPPSPPAPAQDPRQRSVQQRQQQAPQAPVRQLSPAHGALQFSLDDLLGLGAASEPATQQAAPGHPAAPQAQSTAAASSTPSAEELFSVFDTLGQVGTATPPALDTAGSGNPFAAAYAGAHGAAHNQRTSTGAAEPPSPTFGPSSVPGFASFYTVSDPPAGSFAPSSAPTAGRSSSRTGTGGTPGWAGDEEPSPYLGVNNPFTVGHFEELAPPVLQAHRVSPQPAAPPPGPPMRTQPGGGRT
ncbi:hypothetical protein ABPG77_001853 [Micractinium sp. CCAP 211/92]